MGQTSLYTWTSVHANHLYMQTGMFTMCKPNMLSILSHPILYFNLTFSHLTDFTTKQPVCRGGRLWKTLPLTWSGKFLENQCREKMPDRLIEEVCVWQALHGACK